jgi:hypothetical protein
MWQSSPARLGPFAHRFTRVCLQLICPTNPKGFPRSFNVVNKRNTQMNMNNIMHKLKHGRLQENSQPFINSQQKEYTMSILCAMHILIACYSNIYSLHITKHSGSYNRKLSLSSSTIQDTCPSVLAISPHTRNCWKLPPTVPNCHNSLGLPPTNQLPNCQHPCCQSYCVSACLGLSAVQVSTLVSPLCQ